MFAFPYSEEDLGGSEIINHACTLAWEHQDTAALTRCCVITCKQRDLWQRRHRISFPPKFPPEPPTFPHTSFALLLSPPSSISPVLGLSHFPPYKTTFMASTEGALQVSEGHLDLILSQHNTAVNYKQVSVQEPKPDNQAALIRRSSMHGINECVESIQKSADHKHKVLPIIRAVQQNKCYVNLCSINTT